MNPIHVPSDGGKKVNILGIPMVIRLHGRDTGGVVSAVESHDVTGGGPPPHIHHREDETFQVIEGEYEWTVGGKTFIANKSSTILRRAACRILTGIWARRRDGLCASSIHRVSRASSRKSARCLLSNSRTS